MSGVLSMNSSFVKRPPPRSCRNLSCLLITPKDANWIVSILCTDSVIGRNKDVLAGALNITATELLDINRQCSKTSEYLTNIISIWISKAGYSANVQTLISILETQEYRTVKNAILERVNAEGENPVCTYRCCCPDNTVQTVTASTETTSSLSHDDRNRSQQVRTTFLSETVQEETGGNINFTPRRHDRDDQLLHDETEALNKDVQQEMPHKLNFGCSRRTAGIISVGVIILAIVSGIAIFIIYNSRGSPHEPPGDTDSEPGELVTLDYPSSLNYRDHTSITNLAYVRSTTDPPQDWFKGFDRATLKHLVNKGNYTRAQISSEVLGTDIQYSLQTLAFDDPHSCKGFQHNSSDVCTETFEFKKLKMLEFLNIESECTEFFNFFSDCVRFPKGCIIRIFHSTRLKFSERSLNRLRDKTGCQVLVYPVLPLG